MCLRVQVELLTREHLFLDLRDQLRRVLNGLEVQKDLLVVLQVVLYVLQGDLGEYTQCFMDLDLCLQQDWVDE